MVISNLSEAIANVGKGKSNKFGFIELNKALYNSFEGSTKTLDDFWRDFIMPRLPRKEVIMAWHNMLLQYVGDLEKTPVLAIRTGAVSGKLRRGMLTETDAGFSFFYTDNDLALYIYKMALDGYCPTVQEFSKAMKEFKSIEELGWLGKNKTISNCDVNGNGERKFPEFPVHFNKSGGDGEDAKEKELNAFVINGPTPAIGRSGYKHAHLFDAGNNYYIDGKAEGITALCEKYFPLGEYEDWKWDASKSNYCRFLHVEEKEKALGLAKALFLRFVDPINYFLSPSYHKFTNNLPKANQQNSEDIAEYTPLQNYIIDKYIGIYGKDYEDFIDIVFGKKPEQVDGSEVVDVKYRSFDCDKIDKTELINCLADCELECPGILLSSYDGSAPFETVNDLGIKALVDISNSILDISDDAFADIQKRLKEIIRSK